MRFFKRSSTGVCVLALGVVLGTPASGFDASGNDVADALMKTLEATGAEEVSYDSVSANGADTVILGLTTTRTEGGGTNTIKSEKVDIRGGTLSSEGGLTADEVRVTNMTMTQSDEEASISVATASVTDLGLPSAGSIDSGTAIGSAASYGAFVMDKMSIAEPGKPAITVDRLESKILERDSDGVPSSGEIRISEIQIPTEIMGEDDSAADLKALGYETIEIDVYGKGGWSPDGSATLDEMRIDADDMGEFTLKLALGGVTQEVIDGLQTEQADFSEMLGLLNNVTIGNLSIAYEDDGIADKLLDKQAEEMGVSRTEFVDQMTGALPVMLSMLQNPDFEKSVVDAVSAFLSNPQSMTVTAEPAAPVPVAQIFGVAMMAPQTIPTVLSVTVSANQ